MKLEGRVALVTGASQGIGQACALALARQGASVALGARNRQKLEEVAGQIAAGGAKAAVFAMDVSEEDQIKSGIKSAIAHFGKIDILVNNAGITRDQLVMRMKRADLGCGAQHESDICILVHAAGNRLHAQAALGADH